MIRKTNEWLNRFGLVDIFPQLNKFNLQQQGSGNIKLLQDAGNIFQNKLSVFVSKFDLWIKKVEDGNFSPNIAAQ